MENVKWQMANGAEVVRIAFKSCARNSEPRMYIQRYLHKSYYSEIFTAEAQRRRENSHEWHE